MNEMKTQGRPQEIIAAAVRNGSAIDPIFLSWLYEDFRHLQATLESVEQLFEDISGHSHAGALVGGDHAVSACLANMSLAARGIMLVKQKHAEQSSDENL